MEPAGPTGRMSGDDSAGSGSAVEEAPTSPALRARIATLGTQALAEVPPSQVPPQLRGATRFAPARRAKLVGPALISALISDDELRERLGVHVRTIASDALSVLDRADPEIPSGTGLLDAAAAAYIVRPEGWRRLVAAAEAEHSRTRPQAVDDGPGSALRDQVAAAHAESKALRARTREQVDRLKSDNASLRRSLGQARAAQQAAEAAAGEARAAAEQLRAELESATRTAEAENRRFRQRIDQLQSQSGAARRAARDDRAASNVRLRLLLDAVTDSAAGLRRELALPPTEISPADSVPALEPPAPEAAARVGRALTDDDPALLRQLLEVPHSHLLVDGYNVTKTAWPSSPLDQQRTRLTTGVAALVAARGVESTLVFDGSDVAAPPPTSVPRGVRVLFSPPGVIADDLIRQLVAAEPEGRPLVVVTSDRELADSARKQGARVLAALALVRALPT